VSHEVFQASVGQKDWQEFARHPLYTCFSQVCKIDLQGWKMKEGKEQAKEGKPIISYAYVCVRNANSGLP